MTPRSFGPPVTIDCDYLFARFAAAYLLTEGDRALFVENNTAHSVPRLLAALKTSGVSPENVEFLIITHVHLDHAGGTSALLEKCPNATVLAHPRAAPHVIDPSRLVASARKVYGDAEFERLYGTINPVPASRVRSPNDGERVQFGERQLHFIHTRGHANHHMCVLDETSEDIYTGDAFGLAYPDLQADGLFIFPSTSPTDFDPEEARKSVRKIVGAGARRAWLTHFGLVTDLAGAASQLVEWIDFSETLLEEAVRSPEQDSALAGGCETKLRVRLKKALEGRSRLPANVWDLLKLDIELNAAGIAHVAIKRRHPKP